MSLVLFYYLFVDCGFRPPGYSAAAGVVRRRHHRLRVGGDTTASRRQTRTRPCWGLAGRRCRVATDPHRGRLPPPRGCTRDAAERHVWRSHHVLNRRNEGGSHGHGSVGRVKHAACLHHHAAACTCGDGVLVTHSSLAASPRLPRCGPHSAAGTRAAAAYTRLGSCQPLACAAAR